MDEHTGSVLGISFDGLAISGIVNEFLNVAAVFRADGYRILFDLGADITYRADIRLDTSVIPTWVETIRCAGSHSPVDYGADVVNEACALVLSGTTVSSVNRYVALATELAAGIVSTLEREVVRILVVENGTLPDNPLFTEALYMAIDEYGARRALGKYVLWRDHDLMWSTEPHLYGQYPYAGVRRPHSSKYIEYCVATDWMRRRFEAWSGIPCRVIPNRFESPEGLSSPAAKRLSLREAYGIPPDAFLIARCTRVLPAKGIERDIRLIGTLQYRLIDSADPRKVYLFVTGPTNEDPAEFHRLRTLGENLGTSQQIIWADGLLPVHPAFAASVADATRFSIGDLLAEANLSSFLTTYDYEGFGNPPGEAMAAGVPYIVTSYELYHDVYGSKGAVAPLLSIKRDTPVDEPIPDYFTDWVLRTLTDGEYRERLVTRNRELCQRFFSHAALAEELHELFGRTLSPPRSNAMSE